MRTSISILILLLTALTLRLYPSLASGLPFSTDSWSPIRNTELLLKYTPIHLGSRVFDGYNNYWPANSLFGAVLSITTSIKPLEAMALSIPLVGGLTVLIFYVLVYRVSRDRKVALASSILFATAYPHVLFTAGVTKETYANPLYILLLLVFMDGDRWRGIALFTITSIALILAHHLTPLITLAVLFGLALGLIINRVRGWSVFLPVLVLAVVGVLYFKVYAYEGFRVVLSWSEWVSAFAYQVVFFSLASYLTLHYSSRKCFPLGFIAVLTPLVLMLICVRKPIVLGAPTLPIHYVFYMSYSIVIALLAVLGYRGIHGVNRKLLIVVLYWVSAILGLEGYALFSGSELGLTLMYRGVNFLWPPLAVLIASAIWKRSLLTSANNRYVKVTVALAMLVIVLLNLYNFYAATQLEERYMGYQWLYKPQEFNTGLWLASFRDNLTIAGDMKASYLLNGYFNLNTSVAEGYSYLYKGGILNGILYIYKQMLRNGYVVGPYGLDLPDSWFKRLHRLDTIYSNGFVSLFT